MNIQIPGDSQFEGQIEEWISRHARAGTIVVIRVVYQGLVEYRLAEIDAIGLDRKHIYTADYGAFYPNGRKCLEDGAIMRLLIPAGDVLEAALGGESWHNGIRLSSARALTDHEAHLVRRLTPPEASSGGVK